MAATPVICENCRSVTFKKSPFKIRGDANFTIPAGSSVKLGLCACGGKLAMPSGLYTRDAISLVDPKQIEIIITALTTLETQLAKAAPETPVTDEIIREYPFLAYLKKLAPQNFGDLLKAAVVVLMFLRGCSAGDLQEDAFLHDQQTELLKSVIESLGDNKDKANKCDDQDTPPR